MTQAKSEVALADIRQQFEQWIDSQFVNAPGFARRHRYLDGYCQNEVDTQWKAWKACATLRTAASEGADVRGAKLLVWQDTFTDRGDGSKDQTGWEADSGFDRWYRVEQYFASDSYGWQVKFDYEVIADCDDPDQAKDAAQKHFAERIRANGAPYVRALKAIASKRWDENADIDDICTIADRALAHAGESGEGDMKGLASEDRPEDRPKFVAEANIRWSLNVLLETIAAKFDAWDTFDIWKSDAASTVRSFKHNLASPQSSATHDAGRREETFGEDGYNPAYYDGITYAIRMLAQLTDSKDWQMKDGSENHDQDVCDTIMDVLKCAGLYDDETGKFAALTARDAGSDVTRADGKTGDARS